ncbi:MAG: glycerol 3-phosphate dehydrogenase [Flammeovirgaceae bacterium]|nr:glycerol 3-phosphate dehydrogenase [Flammeovirgaceae bacterium]
MALKNTYKATIGVIGTGNFGTAMANLLAEKCNRVLLHARSKEKAAKLIKTRKNGYHKIADNIEIITDISLLAEKCNLIFPIVPSINFRKMMKNLSPYLKPSHILIHGTKGFDFDGINKSNNRFEKSKSEIFTMSEVIRQESSVVRIGCIAGPNLSKEIASKMPTASVIASEFDEVIDLGRKYLKSERFLVFGSNDLMSTELCGILKNIIAVGAGTIEGMKLGENAKSLFITRGMVEMVEIAKTMGGQVKPFLGLAGIGDLIATCSSKLSRNYTVGLRLATGEKLNDITYSMREVAEGIKTIDVIHEWSKSNPIRIPITETLYKIMHEKITVEEAHAYMMKFPFTSEIKFLN